MTEERHAAAIEDRNERRPPRERPRDGVVVVVLVVRTVLQPAER